MSVSKNRILFSVLFISLFVLFSCSLITKNEKPEFYRAHPRAFFNLLMNRSLQVNSFIGSGHLTVESPVDAFQGNVRVYFRQPDSLLVIIQAGFSVPVGSMLMIGSTVQLYNIRDKILYISEGEDVPLDDLIGMNLRAANLIEATLGLPRPPVSYLVGKDSLQIARIGDDFSYTFNTDIEIKKYLANPDPPAFLNYTLIRPMENDTTFCTFGQFRKFKSIRMPQHIQVARYAEKQRLSLFYTRMKVNKDFPNNRFQLNISDHVDVYHLTKSSHE